MSLTLKTRYCYNDDVQVVLGRYSNRRRSIRIMSRQGEPLITASINVPDASLEKDEIVIKDYSENSGVLDFLIKNEIVQLTGKRVKSGYELCHIVKLHPSYLNK